MPYFHYFHLTPPKSGIMVIKHNASESMIRTNLQANLKRNNYFYLAYPDGEIWVIGSVLGFNNGNQAVMGRVYTNSKLYIIKETFDFLGQPLRGQGLDWPPYFKLNCSNYRAH